ncbi:MAG: hypothetical protein KOO61_03500 [Spirochaetales bacterium]|nr:hypothetical protein [Spirochaetales bacterium]
MNAAAVDGSLDTRIDIGDPLRNRLIVEVPNIPLIREIRIVVWTWWADDWLASGPLYRVGTDMPGFALGPLSLTGGVRELGNPHPTSARGTAWHETTGARLDAGIDPGGRCGFSLSPQSLPVHGAVIQTDDGLTAAASIGSWFANGAESGRSWVELTAAASRPADAFEGGVSNSDPAEIGWFERVPGRADMLHLLCRGQVPISLGAAVVEVGPAVGVSLAEAFPPGWWWRLATRAELSLTPGHHELELEAVALSSMNSARYRLPCTSAPAEGAVLALALGADLNEHAGVTTAGRYAMAWRPEAAVPGVAFTLLGLESDEARLDVGAYVAAGRWRFDLGAGLDAEWRDVTDTDGVVPVRAATVGAGVFAGVEYAAPTGSAFPLSAGASLKIAHDDGLHITGANDLQLGPLVSGSDRLFGLSGTVRLTSDDGLWGPQGATLECRMRFHAGPVGYRAGVEVEWDGDSDNPITWNADLGWTVATTGE